jgi:multicomponent Na+:H+ antiporter subunit E
MRLLMWNLVLALVWVFATGEFTLTNLVVGYALGFAVLSLSAVGPRRTGYFARARGFVGFVLFFLWEVLRSAVRVSHDVVTRRHHMRPAVIGVPLEARTDGEITLLANLISLTPGSLSLDLSPDRRVLYVHVMYADEIEQTREHLKRGFERRVLELMR